MSYPRIAGLKNYDAFTAHLNESGIDLPSEADVQSGLESPLSAPLHVHDQTIGNRFCILPSEVPSQPSIGKMQNRLKVGTEPPMVSRRI